MDDPLLRLTEVAQLLNSTVRTVRDWVRDGKLPGVKVGGQWRVPESAVHAFIRHPAPKLLPIIEEIDDTISPAGICLHAPMQDQWRADVEKLQPSTPPPI